MPTFVYMTRCDGCGHCVDICPSDIMHIDTTYRRALNIEPNMCWECYSCVKACPQFAIDCRGYADFAPLGHSVRVRREEDKATISWKIKFRDGREKNFVSPIRTTAWGSIKSPADYAPPSADAVDNLAPLFFRPLPGFEVQLGHVHGIVLFVNALIGEEPAGKVK